MDIGRSIYSRVVGKTLDVHTLDFRSNDVLVNELPNPVSYPRTGVTVSRFSCIYVIP